MSKENSMNQAKRYETLSISNLKLNANVSVSLFPEAIRQGFKLKWALDKYL